MWSMLARPRESGGRAGRPDARPRARRAVRRALLRRWPLYSRNGPSAAPRWRAGSAFRAEGAVRVFPAHALPCAAHPPCEPRHPPPTDVSSRSHTSGASTCPAAAGADSTTTAGTFAVADRQPPQTIRFASRYHHASVLQPSSATRAATARPSSSSQSLAPTAPMPRYAGNALKRDPGRLPCPEGELSMTRDRALHTPRRESGRHQPLPASAAL